MGVDFSISVFTGVPINAIIQARLERLAGEGYQDAGTEDSWWKICEDHAIEHWDIGYAGSMYSSKELDTYLSVPRLTERYDPYRGGEGGIFPLNKPDLLDTEITEFNKIAVLLGGLSIPERYIATLWH